MVSWTFLTSHARVLLLVAHDPGVRLRDIAASLDITERSAFGIITDLVEAGYVVKEKDGRRNRYHIQAHLPLPEPTSQERTVGEVLALLTGTGPAAACKPAAVAGGPGPGRDGPRAAAETGAGRAAGARDGGPRRAARAAQYQAGGGRDVTDVWIANDEGSELVRARDIAVATLDYNGNVTVRLAGADGPVVTLVAHRAHNEEHRPGDLHRQLIRVLAELSDAAGAFLVRAVHDQTRGWQWVTEPL